MVCRIIGVSYGTTKERPSREGRARQLDEKVQVLVPAEKRPLKEPSTKPKNSTNFVKRDLVVIAGEGRHPLEKSGGGPRALKVLFKGQCQESRIQEMCARPLMKKREPGEKKSSQTRCIRVGVFLPGARRLHGHCNGQKRTANYFDLSTSASAMEKRNHSDWGVTTKALEQV